MRLTRDQRGFVMSGLALLLILPAMLLSVSCLAMVARGGETVSTQTIADKVHAAGLGLEDTIKWMWLQSGVPVDNGTLWRLADEWENTTGLLVEVSNVDDNYAKIHVLVMDPLGSACFEEVMELTEFLENQA